jgi:sugar-specific transcriptional regulator TrmB
MALEDLLEKIGLTKNEARTYLSLLDIKEGTGVDIATHAGLHKANCYDALRRLNTKGLVIEMIKGKTKVFKCSPPSMLEGIVAEKVRTVKEVVPQLEKRFLEKVEEKEIELIKGTEGVKGLIDSVAEAKKRALSRVFYEPHSLSERREIDLYMAKRYGGKKILRKLLKMIPPDTPESRKKMTERSKYAFQGNLRYIKQKRISPVSIGIVDDECWVGFITKERKDRMYLKITSKELCDALEEVFDMMWEKAKG